jgi:hypothetical protein
MVSARGCAGGGRGGNSGWGAGFGEIKIVCEGVLNHGGDVFFLMGDVTFVFIEN